MCERLGLGRRAAWIAAAALGFALVAQGAMAHGMPEVDIWSDRGTGGVYHVGDCAEMHFRASDDCYVIVYEIDTDGYLRVLFPNECDDDGYVLGGRTYQIWRDGYSKFYVNGPTGVEYVHVLASYEPFRRVYWDGSHGYDDYAMEATWRGFHDYWGSALPPRVYGDPYTAMQMVDEFICVDGLEAGLVWADFTYFYVGERVHYPRYLCYDCHGFDAHFRPYSDVCVAFSVSFVDCDPGYNPWSWWWWCSPRRAYCGPRFVCHERHDWCDAGHGGHGGRHGDDGQGRTYPSEYKWKSRGEGSGLNVPAVVRTPVTKSGNTADAGKVKSRASTQDRDLYSRKGSVASRPEGRQAVTRDTGSRERVERQVRQAGTSNVEVKQREPRGGQSDTSTPVPRKVVVTDKAKSRSVLGSIAGRVVKAIDGGSHDKPKGVNPQVRRGDKGKSTATRRQVSR